MGDIRTKAKIKFIDFLRPEAFPWPYNIEQAFHVYQWFIKTGEKYRPNTYYVPAIWDLLQCNPSCSGASLKFNRISSTDDLKKRFHYALLYDEKWNPIIAKWRNENGIGLDRTKWLYFNHYTPFTGGNHNHSEAEIKEMLNKFLKEASGKKLNISLNSSHPKARTVYCAYICVTPQRFYFEIDYGYNRDKSSSWDYTIAKTENNEPFTDTMFRAIDKFKEITEKR